MRTLKINVFLWVLLTSLSIVIASFTHPIKMTSSRVLYDVKSHSLNIETKVFVDDFAPVISESLLPRINKGLNEIDKIQIESYFALKFEITINGKKLPMKFDTYDLKGNVMTIKFAKSAITLKKGDEIYIENELLFDEFEELQSNWITLSIPPFLPNHNFACDYENYSYSHTF